MLKQIRPYLIDGQLNIFREILALEMPLAKFIFSVKAQTYTDMVSTVQKGYENDILFSQSMPVYKHVSKENMSTILEIRSMFGTMSNINDRAFLKDLYQRCLSKMFIIDVFNQRCLICFYFLACSRIQSVNGIY